MNRLLLTSLVGASLAAASLAAPASAQYAPPGSYQSSCTNIRVRGNELIAYCTAANGTRVRSMIDINSCRGGDIANSNGQLVCNGGSSYGNGNGRHRHRHHHHQGDNGYGNGGYNNGNGYGRGHDNDNENDNDNDNDGHGRGHGHGNNGNGYGNGYAPSGSYQQSCRNIRMTGGMLTASCPTGNGTYTTTSIDPRSCRGMDIANRNGQLVCQ